MAEHEKKDSGSTNITMLSHNKIGDVFVAIAPALNGWGMFTIVLVALFIGVYWWKNPVNFIALVETSVNTVAGFLTILLWLAVASVGGLVLSKLFLPLVRDTIAIFKPAPTVHAINEHFALYSGGVQVHDHQQEASRRLPAEAPAPLQLPAPPPMTVTPVPTGRELLKSGAVVQALSEGYIILGPGESGGLKTLKIKRCFSTLVSGLPSVGKTTTVFWIVSQLILIGAKLWIVDPHMHFEDEEGNKSLASELDALSETFVFAPCDGEPDAIIDRVRWMYNELLRRQQPGYIVRADQTIIGIMDEFNTVSDSIDPKQVIIQHRGRSLNFSSTIALLEREGRKFGLHFMLIAHKWTQRDIGGDNALRTNATTYLCHKLNDKAQAELLMSGGGKQVLALTVGSYWITGPSWNDQPARITTPMISAADLPLLLQMKQRGHVEVVNMSNVVDADPVFVASAVASTGRPLDDNGRDTGRLTEQPGRPLDATTEDSGLPDDLQVKMLQVLQMDEQGDKNQNDIISEVWGVAPDSRQGRSAKDELKQIRAYLAAHSRKTMGLGA